MESTTTEQVDMAHELAAQLSAATARNYALFHVVRIFEHAISDYQRYRLQRSVPLFQKIVDLLQKLVSQKELEKVRRFAHFDVRLREQLVRLKQVFDEGTYKTLTADSTMPSHNKNSDDLVTQMAVALSSKVPHHYRDYHSKRDGTELQHRQEILTSKNQHLEEEATHLQAKYHQLVGSDQDLNEVIDKCHDDLETLCHAWHAALEDDTLEKEYAYLEALEHQVHALEKDHKTRAEYLGRVQTVTLPDVAQELIERHHLYPELGPNPYPEFRYGLRTVPSCTA